jgi:hypothetical protein
MSEELNLAGRCVHPKYKGLGTYKVQLDKQIPKEIRE